MKASGLQFREPEIKKKLARLTKAKQNGYCDGLACIL